jgi:N-acetylglucosamine-6-phosphate deacetylase
VALIAAGTVVLDGKLCRPGWVQTSGRRIGDRGAGTPSRAADDDFVDGIVVPGFVDMHVHGGGGGSYVDGVRADIQRAADFQRSHGTTTTLASLVTASAADLLAAVAVLAELTAAGTVAGIHLEGPWLSSARCGAHDRGQLRDPDLAEIDALLSAGNGTIRMATIAPELPGATDATRHLVGADVVVAVGHTDASYDQTRSAIEAGATVGTHVFNGMRPLHHRDPGPALALLEDPGVTVELIADGVHVHPALARHVIDTAGADRVALITDGVAAAGLSDGSFRLGSVDVDVVSGVARVRGQSTIAGSTATMDQLFRAAVALLSVPRAGGSSLVGLSDDALVGAVRMTSTTPARALRLRGVGELRPGYAADLVVLDEHLRVTRVMAGGKWQ